MEFQGILSLIGLVNIIQILCSGGKSGILRITHIDDMGEIFFSKGNVVYAKASFKTMKLGEVLESKGFLTSNDISKILEIQKNSNKLFGEIFVEAEFGTMDDIVSSLLVQSEEIIFEILNWEDGFFEFEEDAPLTPEIQQVIDLAPEMVARNQEKIQNLLRLRNKLPSKQLSLQCTVDMMDKIEGIALTGFEWEILSLVDGRNTIDDICRLSNISPFFTSKILYDLMSYSILERVPEEVEYPEVDEFTKDLVIIYTKIHLEFFKRFHEVLGEQAWVLFAKSFNEVKANNIEVFEDISFEPDATINEGLIYKNLLNLPDDSRFLFLKNALNNLITSGLLHLKNAIGRDFYNVIVDEVHKILEKYQASCNDLLRNSLMEIESIIDLVTPLPSDFDKGKELFEKRRFEEAQDKLLNIPKSNPYYVQARDMLKLISEELKKQDTLKAYGKTKLTEEEIKQIDKQKQEEELKKSQFEKLYNEIEMYLGQHQLRPSYQVLHKLKEINPEADEIEYLEEIIKQQLDEELKYKLGEEDEILIFTQVFNPDDMQYYNLTSEEGFIISRIDGTKDIKTILQMSGLPILQAKLILLEIQKAGLITTESAERAKKSTENEHQEQEYAHSTSGNETQEDVVTRAQESEKEDDAHDTGFSTGDKYSGPKTMLERIGRVRKRRTPKKKSKSKKLSDKDKIMRVLKYQQFIKGKKPHEILRVPLDASQEELKSAFRKLAAEFHPDLYQSEVYEGLQRNIKEIFEVISDSYQNLSGKTASVSRGGPAGEPASKDKPKESVADRKLKAHKAYQSGMQAYNQQNFETAISYFEEAIANYSNNPVYFSMLNDARSRARSGNAYSIFNEGLKLYEIGDIDKALQRIKAAIKMDPTVTVFYSKTAEILNKHTNHQAEAEKYAHKAVEMEPDNPALYILLGRTLKAQKKFAEARQEFNIALKWDRNNKTAMDELRSLP